MAEDLEVARHRLRHLRRVFSLVTWPATAVRTLATILDRGVKMHHRFARQVREQRVTARTTGIAKPRPILKTTRLPTALHTLDV